jgi:hypothetical protein
MKRVIGILVLTGAIAASAQVRQPNALAALKTRAERMNYQETSRYDDVVKIYPIFRTRN